MKTLKLGTILAVGLILSVGLFAIAEAHFGMIIPSTEIVTQQQGGEITLTVMFTHSFERNGMDMAKPARFGAKIRGGKVENLLPLLKPIKIQGCQAWKAAYRLKRPGDYIIFDQPQPYFEPAEGKFIVHYTKVVVNGYGMEDGGDAKVGLDTEIIPLSRPNGPHTGNVFR